MHHNPLPNLVDNPEIYEQLRPLCRLKPGEIWQDPKGRHRVGCLDATSPDHIKNLLKKDKAHLAIHDPPYNLVLFEMRQVETFIEFCRQWIHLTEKSMHADAALYIWLGADQKDGFRPLPEFMIMMRAFEQFASRSFITLRNQRGYGTQQNWMAVRQELLYYTKGKPPFQVIYTDIPKVLQGYYKVIGGELTENIERSKSKNIRPGNVWLDIQQIFYRMEENVSGCYAQKPLKAIERIIEASSQKNNLILDFFAHSGTTLLASERLGRRCYTCDFDPIFCEMTIRRLEHFRKTGKLGWQNGHAFEEDLDKSVLAAQWPLSAKSSRI